MPINQSPNWLLYYKTAGGLPGEFAELLTHANALSYRTGNVKTRGESEDTPYADSNACRAAFDRRRRQIETAGFVLAREWHFDPPAFDFARLTQEIALAARQAFTLVRQVHADERINAYAVVTDDGAMTLVPAANSAEALKAAGDEPDVLWNSGEWSCLEGGEFFDIPYRLLLTQHQGDWPKVPFEEFAAGVAEASVRALELLDRESFFGTGPERDNSVVLFQIADSEYLPDAVKRLNTPPAYARFRKWWKSWN